MSGALFASLEIGREPHLTWHMKSLINASFHWKKNSLINAALFCFHLFPPHHAPFPFWDLSLRGRAQQHLWSGNEQAVQQIKMRPWVSSGSCCPPKPPSPPPFQVLGLCQRTSQAGRKGKQGKRESLLLHPAQALWGCWYSWYVMSFSRALAGSKQGTGRVPRALVGAQMALWPINTSSFLPWTRLQCKCPATTLHLCFHRGNAARAFSWHC